MNILQKCEGNPSSGGVVGHAERGDAVGALGVEDVAVLRVGDVAVGAAVGEALEDLARDGARVGGCRAVLRQHHRAARHQRVQDCHLACSLGADPLPSSPPAAASAVWTRRGRRKGERFGLGWAKMEETNVTLPDKMEEANAMSPDKMEEKNSDPKDKMDEE